MNFVSSLLFSLTVAVINFFSPGNITNEEENFASMFDDLHRKYLRESDPNL